MRVERKIIKIFNASIVAITAMKLNGVQEEPPLFTLFSFFTRLYLIDVLKKQDSLISYGFLLLRFSPKRGKQFKKDLNVLILTS